MSDLLIWQQTWIERIFKTLLHCHLEGSIQPAPLLKVAARNNIELPFSDEEGANKYYQLKTMFHGDVVDNYLQVAKTFNLTADDIKKLASFMDDLSLSASHLRTKKNLTFFARDLICNTKKIHEERSLLT